VVIVECGAHCSHIRQQLYNCVLGRSRHPARRTNRAAFDQASGDLRSGLGVQAVHINYYAKAALECQGNSACRRKSIIARWEATGKMVNETALKDALLAIVNDAKSSYIMLSSLNSEIEALRETVRALDPTFADVMAQKTKEIEAKNAVAVQAVLAAYDEKFRVIQDGYVC
jgi:hypothetical protein